MLETQGLLLKAAAYEDWMSIYHNLWRHEESAKYMLWRPCKTPEEAQARMKRTLAFQQSNPWAYFVYEKKTGQAIGFAGMTQIAPGVYEDIGIALGPQFTGQGYGKQLLSALVGHSFTGLGGTQFVSSCRRENFPCHKLLLACGFSFTYSENRVDPRDDQGYILEFYQVSKQKSL